MIKVLIKLWAVSLLLAVPPLTIMAAAWTGEDEDHYPNELAEKIHYTLGIFFFIDAVVIPLLVCFGIAIKEIILW